MSRELRREMSRRLRMHGERAQRFLTFVDAVLAVAFTEDRLVAGLVHQRAEVKRAGSPGVAAEARERRTAFAERAADRPTRQHFRELRDVGLRVAAVDAERVQLEDLAREILVETELAAAVAAHERRGLR